MERKTDEDQGSHHTDRIVRALNFSHRRACLDQCRSDVQLELARYQLSNGQQLDSISLDMKDFDYLILNHMEPDHIGWLHEFVKINPAVQIVTTPKGVELLKAFCGITKNVVNLYFQFYMLCRSPHQYYNIAAFRWHR